LLTIRAGARVASRAGLARHARLARVACRLVALRLARHAPGARRGARHARLARVARRLVTLRLARPARRARHFRPYHAAVQASVGWKARLDLYPWSSGGELDIEIEFVTRLRASCTRVLNHRILTQTHPGGLEPGYGRLFRWDRLCR